MVDLKRLLKIASKDKVFDISPLAREVRLLRAPWSHGRTLHTRQDHRPVLEFFVVEDRQHGEAQA